MRSNTQFPQRENKISVIKNIFFIIPIIFILGSCTTVNNNRNKISQSSTSDFNQKLADSLEADQYGMKPYIIVMLTTGKTKIEESSKMSELMKGHMENIGKLAKNKKLTVAGPFSGKNERNYRGMSILNVKTIEEGEPLVKTDPAVKAGVFDYEIFKWYGSAALPLYLKHHKEISKENH